jgi:hypothetical protein
MDVLDEEQEKLNRAKYGDKEYDVISDSYRNGKKIGDAYCGFNAIKYIKRYIGNSHKSENATDIDKAIDYLNRIKEKGFAKQEVIETKS